MSSSRSSFTIALLGGVVIGATAATLMIKTTNKDTDDDEDRGRGLSAAEITSRRNRNIELNDTVTQLVRNTTNFDVNVTHVNFISDIMARLWPYINEAGCTIMRETMEPMFAEMMPGPMKSLKFTKLNLGSVPIVFDNIIVHEVRNGILKFDWDVTWNSKVDIHLAANMGVGFGVKTITLKGRMSFLLHPLSNAIPCFDAIQYSFINPPELNLDFTGLANTIDLVAYEKMRKIMLDIITSMMVLPIRKVIKMNDTTNLWDIHVPLYGVARVTLLRGRGFQIEKRSLRKDDVPDVYVKMTLGAGDGRGNPDEWKSSIIKNDCNPDWTKDTKKREAKDFLLADLDQILTIEAWDEDTGIADSDDFLGRCQVVVGQILLAGKTMELELVHEHKKGGNYKSTESFITVALDILPFTTGDHSSLKQAKENHSMINPDNQLVGLLTVLVTKAFNIPVKKSDAASFVKVLYGDDTEVGVTGTVVDVDGIDAINPSYEASFHLPLKPQKPQQVKLQLFNNETILGEIVVEHDQLLKAKGQELRKNAKIGKDGASLEFYISLSGVKTDSKGATTASAVAAATTSVATSQVQVKDRSIVVDADSSSPEDSTKATSPVSVPGVEKIRVTIVKGTGFAVRKKRKIFKINDVPDVYCIVKFGSSPQTQRTKTIRDNIAPIWNERFEYPMSSPNQIINIDVYDENKRTKDDFYGNARVAVGKVLLNGGSMDVEIISQEGKKTGRFITVSSVKL